MEETGGPKSDDGWPDIAAGYYLYPERVWNGQVLSRRDQDQKTTKPHLKSVQ